MSKWVVGSSQISKLTLNRTLANYFRKHLCYVDHHCCDDSGLVVDVFEPAIVVAVAAAVAADVVVGPLS